MISNLIFPLLLYLLPPLSISFSIDCHSSKDALLHASTPNRTAFIRSLYLPPLWNHSLSYFNLSWSAVQWALFHNVYLENITSIIGAGDRPIHVRLQFLGDTSLKMADKHAEICDVIWRFLDQYVEKMFLLCLPLGGWGFMGEYLKCSGFMLYCF